MARTMMHIANGRVYRWAPHGSFIAVWDAPRTDEHVPDDMLELPDWVNRAQVDRDVFKFLAVALDVRTAS